MNDFSRLKNMSDEYLEQLFSEIKEIGQFNTDLIKYLEDTFPEQGEKIIEVLKRKVMKYIYLPSGRVIWMIKGEKQKRYLLYPKIFCSCQDFYKNTVIKKTRPYCKHIIAQIISEALQIFIEKEKEDEKFNMLIKRLKSEF